MPKLVWLGSEVGTSYGLDLMWEDTYFQGTVGLGPKYDEVPRLVHCDRS